MSTQAVVYALPWRLLAAALKTVAGASAVALAAAIVLSVESINPLRLIRLFINLVLVPAAVAALIQRLFTVSLSVSDRTLVLVTRGRRVEIPTGSIAGVAPWIVPLPAGGVWLRLRSGRRFRLGIQTADPVALVDALAEAGTGRDVEHAADHPMLVYQRAKRAESRRWFHPLLKFVVFALVPALPLWRVHQFIAYGGTFGEYYQYGLKAYLLGFSIYWVTLIVYLVLYAAVLRAVTETVCLGAAWVAPSRAARVRRAAEIVYRVLYYGGVPALVLVRFLPW